MGNYQTLQVMYGQSSVALELRALAISAGVLVLILAVLAVLTFAIRPRQPSTAEPAAVVRQRVAAAPPTDEAQQLVRTLDADELGRLLLGRVRRLVALSAFAPDPDAPEARLARWALLSTIRDCEAAGLGDAARALLASAGAPYPNPAG